MSEKGEEKVQLEELEELFEEEGHLPSQPPLPEGSVIQDPEQGTNYKVKRVLNLQVWRPPYNIYEVSIEVSETALSEQSEVSVDESVLTEESKVSSPHVFWLWEATTPSAVASLQYESDILKQVNAPMFPKVYAQFHRNGNFYLLTEALPERTLAETMEQKGLTFLQFLTLLSQVAYALDHLHRVGWVHLGLRPQIILMGKPIKLVDFRWAVRIGEKLNTPFYHTGYSPPELLQTEEPVDERYDIFSVGALLYHFVNGQPIPETGVQLVGWQCLYSGVPQILHRCLGPKEERYPNMQVLHQELLRLKHRYTPTVTYTVAGATTIGLEPSRTTNQDAYGYLEAVAQSETGSVRWLVACVADGMGGMEAGEVASETAVKTFLSEAASVLNLNAPLSANDQARIIKEWVDKANERVCAALEQKRAKGGTTLLGCLLVEKRLSIAHIGDCRLYLVRNGEAILLTRDHSLAMVLAMQEGKVDLDALRHHPDRSRLTRSLGDRSPLPHYFVDSLEITTGKPVMELQNGDTLLLCSDGLWEPVTEQEMVSVLEEHAHNLSEAAHKLLGLALERGASDNVTVLLIRIGEEMTQKSNLCGR